jgi:hypothetical protein
MSADGSANRSARARLRRLDSQALLPRCLGYRCPGDPSRQRRRARLPAKGVQRPPLEELNLVQRSASLRICGPRSSPALSEELTQISAPRFPPCDAVFTQSSHQEARPAGGLGPGFCSQRCRDSGKMRYRPLRFANEPSFGEFPNVWPLRRGRRTAATLLSVSGGPFHA